MNPASAVRVNTKNDLEDLPTTWGGYDKLPIRQVLLKLGKPAVAMSASSTPPGASSAGSRPEAIRARRLP